MGPYSYMPTELSLLNGFSFIEVSLNYLHLIVYIKVKRSGLGNCDFFFFWLSIANFTGFNL
jgi:hypothetical protein